ncbi:MAG: polysaccharide deacetylase family protein [Bacteroidia bacterium]|nr:polysaccharide deacetylase family protein [Bacteroidia bacterium]MDW8134328.1 polysaccharide deacetylase family protein [Bacteroidia bacterium]
MHAVLRWLAKRRIMGYFYEGEAVILALHRVCHTPSLLGPSFCISPTELVRILNNLRHEGFLFISLDRLIQALHAQIPLRRAVVITIDDGYEDFINEAYLIFQRFGVPFTLYLVSGFVRGELFPWWVGLEILIRERESFTLEGERYISYTITQKKRLFLRLWRLYKKYPPRKACDLIEVAFRREGLATERLYELSLNEDAVKRLAQDPLCTVGAHTSSHFWLPLLDRQTLIAELEENKTYLERLVHKEVLDFAYPYGGKQDIPKGIENLLKEIGYRSAVSLMWSPVYGTHRNFLFYLPRRVVSPSLSAHDLCRSHFTRIFPFL